MLVNKIWSSKTQLPYSYYSLPFCRPAETVTERENIGQVLVGDRIQNSDYKVRVHGLFLAHCGVPPPLPPTPTSPPPLLPAAPHPQPLTPPNPHTPLFLVPLPISSRWA